MGGEVAISRADSYLPRLLGGEENTIEPATQRTIAGRGEGETILVVEDEDDLRSYAIEALGELGYKVLDASDGAAALAIMAQHPRVDLLFTDVVLSGGMNGRALVDEARRRRPGLKVLFTTGYTSKAIIHHGRLDPGVHLIGKPFTYDELAPEVKRLIDS